MTPSRTSDSLDINPGTRGEWTVTFRGGPALWHNVVAVLTMAAQSRPPGPTRDVAAHMQNAQATFIPDHESPSCRHQRLHRWTEGECLCSEVES